MINQCKQEAHQAVGGGFLDRFLELPSMPIGVMSSYPRGSKLGRHRCRVKFGDSRTNSSRDIRTAHFVMDNERRRSTFCLKIHLLIAAYYQHDGPYQTVNDISVF